MARAKKDVFSVAKAVKLNARDRVGQPKPEAVLPDDKTKSERRQKKHKETLEEMLRRSKEE